MRDHFHVIFATNPSEDRIICVITNILTPRRDLITVETVVKDSHKPEVYIFTILFNLIWIIFPVPSVQHHTHSITDLN